MSLTPRSVENIKTKAQAALEILLDTLDDAVDEIRDGATRIAELQEQVSELEVELIAKRNRYSELERMLGAARMPKGAPFDEAVAP